MASERPIPQNRKIEPRSLLYCGQGGFIEIKPESQENIAGIYTSGMEDCCHVVVSNKDHSHIFLAHLDDTTDLSDPENGVSAWIKAINSSSPGKEIIIDIYVGDFNVNEDINDKNNYAKVVDECIAKLGILEKDLITRHDEKHMNDVCVLRDKECRPFSAFVIEDEDKAYKAKDLKLEKPYFKDTREADFMGEITLSFKFDNEIICAPIRVCDVNGNFYNKQHLIAEATRLNEVREAKGAEVVERGYSELVKELKEDEETVATLKLAAQAQAQADMLEKLERGKKKKVENGESKEVPSSTALASEPEARAPRLSERLTSVAVVARAIPSVAIGIDGSEEEVGLSAERKSEVEVKPDKDSGCYRGL